MHTVAQQLGTCDVLPDVKAHHIRRALNLNTHNREPVPVHTNHHHHARLLTL